MDPRTALEFIDQAVSIANMSRKDHANLMEAIRTIQGVVQENVALKTQIENLANAPTDPPSSPTEEVEEELRKGLPPEGNGEVSE